MDNEMMTVPYVVFEGEMARAERHIKRLVVLLIALIIALLATNIGWLIYESQFDTYYYETAQDGNGINNVNVGNQGDITYEPESAN